MSLLFHMLRLVITFLPRSKCLLISWLQSPSAVILEPPENKVWHCFHCFPIYLLWSDGTRCHDLRMLSFKPAFSLSSCTFIKRLFSSSSLSAIRALVEIKISSGVVQSSVDIYHLPPLWGFIFSSSQTSKLLPKHPSRGSPGGSVVKNPPANAGDVDSIPGSERSPRGWNSNPLQYSCLGNPIDREAWWYKRVRHDLATKQQTSFKS